MECPKCGYSRQPSDTAPDYECPKCGIIYEKFRQAVAAKAEKAARDAEVKRRADEIEAQQAEKRQRTAEESRFARAVALEVAKRQPRKGIHPIISWGAIGVTILLIVATARQPAPQTPPRPAATVQKATPQSPKQPTAPSPEEVEKRRLSGLESAARERCFEEIRRRAVYPSTVDISWFTGTGTVRSGAGTLVQADFTAKNALGATLPYQARCKVSDSGELTLFDARPR